VSRIISEDILANLLGLYGITGSEANLQGIMGLLFRNGLAETGTADPSDGAGRLHFGITEFSFSFSSNSAPGVRCLAEVVKKQPVQSCELRDAWLMGSDMLKFLGETSGETYDIGLFEDIFQIAYCVAGSDLRSRPLRFGFAIEWRPKRFQSVKCYFDLYSQGRDCVPKKLSSIFDRLGFSSHLRSLEGLGIAQADTSFCRTIGLDFSPARKYNLRVYLPGSIFTLERLSTLLDRTGASDRLDSLQLFNKIILNNTSPRQSLRSMLVSLVFAAETPNTVPLLKLDAYLPSCKPDDQASCQSIIDLSSRLDFDMPCYGEALEAVANGRLLTDIHNLQQYLSMDLLPHGHNKVNVYVRPFGLATPHLGPKLCPRLKSFFLRDIDAAIRTCVVKLQESHTTAFRQSADGQGNSYLHLAPVCDALLEAASTGFQVDLAGVEECLAAFARAKGEARGARQSLATPDELGLGPGGQAQMLQVLVKSGLKDSSELAGVLISLLSKMERVPDDGNFKTWIGGRCDDGDRVHNIPEPVQASARHGMDLEAIANLLYALYLCDAARYEALIRRGIDCIVAKQTREGCWTANASSSLFNTTFVCARLVSVVIPEHHALPRVAGFLRQSTGSVDGWGHPCGSPANTAFGLLMVALLRTTMAFNPSIVQQAANIIVNWLFAQGRGRAADFIPVEPSHSNRSDGNRIPDLATSQSNTITAAICLKALCIVRCAWIDIEQSRHVLPQGAVNTNTTRE
jgi:hypothetical protein